MTNLRQERVFNRRQGEEPGGRVVHLHKDLLKIGADLRRSRMTVTLIQQIYKLINRNTTTQELVDSFLTLMLSGTGADRAVIFCLDRKNNRFIRQGALGFTDKPARCINIPDGLPEYLFVNSWSKTDHLTDFFNRIICTPCFLWSYNRAEGVALLIGSQGEEKKFSLPFGENDRELVESSLNVFIDIVKRKEAEQELLRSEEKYRRLVQSSPEAFYIYSKGTITFANEAGIKLLGAGNAGEVLGKSPFDYFHPDDHDSIRQRIEDIIEQRLETSLFEKQLTRIDGKKLLVQVIMTPFTLKKQPAIQVIVLDISERKRREKELMRIEQLESLGVLAGGIAHDFNNLLAGVLGNIDLAKSSLDPDQKPYTYLKNATGALYRARDLTQKLLTFSKGGAPVKEITSLAELVTGSVDFILSGSMVKCNYVLPRDLQAVDIDVVQVKQVVENLAMNAMQAMPEGGGLTVELSNVDQEELLALPLDKEKYVKLMIRDEGKGIPPEVLPKIFDPYFSTKDQGSGLGLATTYSIVRKHGGLITVESIPEKGTAFYVYYPATDKKPSPVIIEKQEESVCQQVGRGNILVMDDEELIRDVAGEMLTSLGYDATAVSEGDEVIACYLKAKETDRPFDAVIMDLTIPGGQGGRDIVQRLLTHDPDVKVIIASGSSNDQVISHYKKYGFKGVLIKPFSIESLGEELGKIIS